MRCTPPAPSPTRVGGGAPGRSSGPAGARGCTVGWWIFPGEWVGAEIVLEIDGLDPGGRVWWNGEEVGRVDGIYSLPRDPGAGWWRKGRSC